MRIVRALAGMRHIVTRPDDDGTEAMVTPPLPMCPIRSAICGMESGWNDGSSGDRPMLAAPRRITTLLALTMLLAACGTADAPAGRAPTTEPAAPVSPGTVPISDPTAGLTEVTWLPTADPFGEADLAGTAVEDWPALFAALPRPSTSDPLTVTMTLLRDPDACTLWHRFPTGVDMGPGDAAARMAAAVLAVVGSGEHAPGPLLATGETGWCDERPREALAFLATDVAPAFCSDIDGRDVRCITVTTMRYDGGAHGMTWQTDLVFDVASGEQLGADVLLSAADSHLEDGTVLVEELVCALDHAEGLLSPVDECWEVVLRNVRPTPAGLLFSFAPYESGPYVLGPRDLFVPRDVLAEGPRVPAAVHATQRALVEAVRAADWEAIAALLPADGRFTASFGDTTDPIAYYRSLPRDPLAEWLVVLTQPAGTVAELIVWPELHGRDPFVITSDERPWLAVVYGEDFLRNWESAGAYLGWRAGFDADGTWRFMVAGD
jgi:hypothetical protein